MLKQLVTFIAKEWMHIWRDRRTLIILFGMPLVQMLIFGFALSTEVKNSKVAVLDPSKDEATQAIIHRIDASKYFDVTENLYTPQEIEPTFRRGKIKLAIVFPEHFRETLIHTNKAQIQLIADASDPNIGTTITNYANAIIRDYQQQLQSAPLPYEINTEIRMLYNPQLESAYNFVPGVMSMILLLVCTMMTSIAIVREKETGTMEVLLASPLKPAIIIISKAVPYLFLSTINIATILLLSYFVLEVPIKGSLVLLIAASILFIITALSLGLLISTIAPKQDIAMFISLIGMFLPTLMFSGFMFPIENMPVPLQVISNIVPAKWYYYIVKSVMIKGLGISAIWREVAILTGMSLFLLVVSTKKFKIRLA
jgi:ABC-2 type transport system permease protein